MASSPGYMGPSLCQDGTWEQGKGVADMVKVIKGIVMRNGTPLQLKDILIKARDRHITRQHSYANELVKYEPAEQMTGDPASTLKSRLQDHSNKAAKLNFIAERLVVDAVYDVTPYDLENVGVDLTVDGR
jgi:hypothetical protein